LYGKCHGKDFLNAPIALKVPVQSSARSRGLHRHDPNTLSQFRSFERPFAGCELKAELGFGLQLKFIMTISSIQRSASDVGWITVVVALITPFFTVRFS